jgi:hypothetical protein
MKKQPNPKQVGKDRRLRSPIRSIQTNLDYLFIFKKR